MPVLDSFSLHIFLHHSWKASIFSLYLPSSPPQARSILYLRCSKRSCVCSRKKPIRKESVSPTEFSSAGYVVCVVPASWSTGEQSWKRMFQWSVWGGCCVFVPTKTRWHKTAIAQKPIGSFLWYIYLDMYHKDQLDVGEYIYTSQMDPVWMTSLWWLSTCFVLLTVLSDCSKLWTWKATEVFPDFNRDRFLSLQKMDLEIPSKGGHVQSFTYAHCGQLPPEFWSLTTRRFIRSQ